MSFELNFFFWSKVVLHNVFQLIETRSRFQRFICILIAGETIFLTSELMVGFAEFCLFVSAFYFFWLGLFSATWNSVSSRGGVKDARLEAKAKDTKKHPRPRTAFPRTDPLVAKDRNARGQGQGHQRKCSQKKRSSEEIFKRSPEKTAFQKIFQALHKLLTAPKIVLSSNRG